jgi:hypothetical protein
MAAGREKPAAAESRVAAAPASGCPPIQNPIFVGPGAPWVQPQRADAGAALGPEFRSADTMKTISKRSRGAGAQDWPCVSSAAVGRCVDKLLHVAPEDKLLTAAIGALGKMGRLPHAPSPAGRRRRRS